LAGSSGDVLSKPGYIALSASASKRYFGNEDPIGKLIILNDDVTLKVTGVFQDLPHHTHLNFDIVISNKGLLTKWNTASWGLLHSYVKLKEGTSMPAFQEKLQRNFRKYWDDYLKDKGDRKLDMFIQPLQEIAFSTPYLLDGPTFQKSRTLLVTLATLSVVILLLGWINYVNLSVSAMTIRLKEFGTRRANGADAVDVAIQCLTEAALLNFLAIGIALTLLQVIRNPAAMLFNIHVANFGSIDTNTILIFGAAALTGVLATGLYPALISMKFRARELFTTGKAKLSKSPVLITLTTLQYAAAMVLIVWGFTVQKQLSFILNRDIGLAKDNVIVIDGAIVKSDHYEQDVRNFLDHLKSKMGLDATFSSYMVGEPSNKPGDVEVIGSDKSASTRENGVSEDFIDFFDIPLLAGRNFVKDDRSDAIIVSRVVSEALGYSSPEECIGLSVNITNGDWNKTQRAQIIGVIQDYRIQTFFRSIDNEGKGVNTYTEGIALTYQSKLFPELEPENICVRVAMSDLENLLKSVRQEYLRVFPGNVFRWKFLDDRVNDTYKKEKVARNQISLFAVLSMIIACLGLLGITTNKALQKTKEIDIRKVLGARLHHVVVLLISSAIGQIAAAALVGLPIAFFLTGKYLEKFSEKVIMQWWHYGVPLMVLLIIMLMTVSTVVWRAARRNPVEGLKHD